jgi:protocatechuate 3,4-dioxygenase beta subunit
MAGGLAAERAGAGPAAVATGAVACVLTPERSEGPYYIPGEKVRRNITEGRPGVPLELRTTVVHASTCRPIRGAAVDIWHCDAEGVYSGFTSGGGGGGGQRRAPTDETTFMRGVQRTDAAGLALFRTIYPGWYQSRAVHIHLKVHVGGDVVHTGQLFFPDAVSDAVYARSPYSSRPGRAMRNRDDSIFANGGRRGLVRIARSGSGYAAGITLGVMRS